MEKLKIAALITPNAKRITRNERKASPKISLSEVQAVFACITERLYLILIRKPFKSLSVALEAKTADSFLCYH